MPGLFVPREGCPFRARRVSVPGRLLLGRLLSRLPGVSCIGEVRITWRALADDEDCSCGQPASRCTVWQQVRAALGTPLAAQRATAEAVPTLPLLSGVSTGRRAAVLPKQTVVAEQWRTLYQAFSAATGAEVLVDTSKAPASLLAALATGPPVSVIHLVRDPRGVVLSEMRTATGHRGVQALRATAHWWFTQSITERHSEIPAHTHLAYEELVRDPLDALSAAWPAALAERIAPQRVLPVQQVDGQFVLPDGPPLHDLAGNRVRKLTGELRLRQEEAWRRELCPLAQLAIGAATHRVRRRLFTAPDTAKVAVERERMPVPRSDGPG